MITLCNNFVLLVFSLQTFQLSNQNQLFVERLVKAAINHLTREATTNLSVIPKKSWLMIYWLPHIMILTKNKYLMMALIIFSAFFTCLFQNHWIKDRNICQNWCLLPRYKTILKSIFIYGYSLMLKIRI